MECRCQISQEIFQKLNVKDGDKFIKLRLARPKFPEEDGKGISYKEEKKNICTLQKNMKLAGKGP